MNAYTLFELLLAIVVALNMFATWRLVNDPGFERSQKWVAGALIWLMPLMVAILYIAMTNKSYVENPEDKYWELDASDLPDLMQMTTVGAHAGD